MDNITDVFFDLDHTLWDFDKNSSLAFKRVFANHRLDIALEEFLRFYEPINLEYWKAYREERVSKQELRRGRLVDTFRKLKREYDIEVIDTLAEAYITELPGDNYLLKGAHEILDYLFPKYNLHIITNGFTQVQHVKMKNSGIGKYFKTITTSEAVGVKKPNPLVFKTALDSADAIPENSIMIGDSFEADILGAKAVKMHTIFYNYRNEKPPGTFSVANSLLDIKKFL
ncbi:YjjG family noncanonical pyrimidine nucleotidase [Marinirhabdus gelatinilytica]|uniref:Putative hydrolase of the HAD superfamily n=1 Tax=Marinirhabdus gelatinilytica TaxID=1703343 RepID=A0A370QLK7_9FLAO|nr:YjjG family noncanonical pyrimidine nucleotidase [Marinirhabdus gelatinilytica]RDK89258.1 putative hydrolase of the HAD superfamily [Marinirhabdus gelatinilytica]